MPSLGDTANEVKALLEDVKNNTLGTSNNTATIIQQLNQLDIKVAQVNNTAQTGFTNLAQGLGILIQLQAQNNDLLASNNKQNVTIICWLDHIAHVLCDIKHNTDMEIKLQREISATLTHLDDILELVHAHEAMEVMNNNDLKKRLEECCPKEEPAPQPCFKDCESPRLPDYNPIRTDWKPIHYNRPTGNEPPK
jgi:uncharacterized phage infection (PIP) family protein YhgE